MAEIVQFSNFAKLKDIKLEFNDITVLAGKPSTGKSYVMKFMYAVYKSLDLTVDEYIKAHKKFNDLMVEYINITKKYDSETLKNLSIYDKTELDSKLKRLKRDGIKLYEYYNSQGFSKKIEKQRRNYLKNLLESMYRSIEQISNDFEIKSKNLYINYTQDEIREFTYEIKVKEKKNSDEFPLIYSDFSMYEKQFLQEPIFVETPLILEFKSFMKREKGKTPYHIESLLNILDTDYSFTDEEQEKFIKNFREKSQLIIGGDIESSGDSFIFNKKNDKVYDILNASSGVKSIGLLQYLVTNKALKKDSILFWEEPEVHLHPKWQLKMIELFIELMKAGVKIVFSTHSPYMADYLNAISQKQNLRDRVSFNLLQEQNGVVENFILKTDDDWKKIQEELLDPLEEIMWEYI